MSLMAKIILKMRPNEFEFDSKKCIQIKNLSSSKFETRMLIRYKNSDKK